MTLAWILLLGSAAIAGAVNSIAGGGTLLTFPVLMSVLGGTPDAAKIANMTSTIALVPGSVAAIWGYRDDFARAKFWAITFGIPSFVGGIIGALLLVWAPAEDFRRAIPWLLLLATLLFAFQPQMARWFGIGGHHERPTRTRIILLCFTQVLCGIYGGFFGAGNGILMLANLALAGLENIHEMNALKSLFAAVINGVAVVLFVWDGNVIWTYALPMAGAAIAGGYWGAKNAKKVPKERVRLAIIAVGTLSTILFFYR